MLTLVLALAVAAQVPGPPGAPAKTVPQASPPAPAKTVPQASPQAAAVYAVPQATVTYSAPIAIPINPAIRAVAFPVTACVQAPVVQEVVVKVKHRRRLFGRRHAQAYGACGAQAYAVQSYGGCCQ